MKGESSALFPRLVARNGYSAWAIRLPPFGRGIAASRMLYMISSDRLRSAAMSTKSPKDPENAREPISEDQARRDFLKKAGRFAVVTPPAITLLLGTSLNSRAIAGSAGSGGAGGSGGSGGSRPGYGFGDSNHGHSGPPGQNSCATRRTSWRGFHCAALNGAVEAGGIRAPYPVLSRPVLHRR